MPARREPEALDQLARFILQIQERPRRERRRQITLVIEEMNLGYPVEKLPGELGGIAQICNQGRYYGVDVIGVTQRPALISGTFRGNIAEAFIPLLWASDSQAILQMIGQRYRVELESLPNYLCLHWRNGQVTQRGNR